MPSYLFLDFQNWLFYNFNQQIVCKTGAYLHCSLTELPGKRHALLLAASKCTETEHGVKEAKRCQTGGNSGTESHGSVFTKRWIAGLPVKH